MISVGVELGARLMEREPPDVDGATRFAAELFLGGLERMAARRLADSSAPSQLVPSAGLALSAKSATPGVPCVP